MASRDQDRLQTYPPTHLHRSIPLSLQDAQARVANYLALADMRENTHLHPDAQITSSGINRGSSAGNSGGLILTHLRRVQKGLNGERIELDPKLFDAEWEDDIGGKASDDTKLDALIAKGGYGGGTYVNGNNAESKKNKRKRDDTELQEHGDVSSHSSRKQKTPRVDGQQNNHGQPDDTEGWQTMESYQREMEEEGEEEGDLGLRHNFRQQTAPEPEIRDTEMQVEVGAAQELDTAVQKDLQVGKERVKKKRKRMEEDEQRVIDTKSQDNAAKKAPEEERKTKKAKTDSTAWSFKGLENLTNGSSQNHSPAEQPSQENTAKDFKEARKEKAEKREKSEKKPKPKPQPPDLPGQSRKPDKQTFPENTAKEDRKEKAEEKKKNAKKPKLQPSDPPSNPSTKFPTQTSKPSSSSTSTMPPPPQPPQPTTSPNQQQRQKQTPTAKTFTTTTARPLAPKPTPVQANTAPTPKPKAAAYKPNDLSATMLQSLQQKTPMPPRQPVEKAPRNERKRLRLAKAEAKEKARMQ